VVNVTLAKRPCEQADGEVVARLEATDAAADVADGLLQQRRDDVENGAVITAVDRMADTVFVAWAEEDRGCRVDDNCVRTPFHDEDAAAGKPNQRDTVEHHRSVRGARGSTDHVEDPEDRCLYEQGR
jgi:hypothetical protein